MTERWVGLELRHLLTLEAIAEEGSFKAAARALGYTPSAVSQQIAALERAVGVQVIAREQGRQALGLTEAGRILLRHLAPIHAHLDAARGDLEALASGFVGTLRVGAFESVGTRLLPEVVGRFRDVFPQILVEISEALSELDHLRSVEQRVLDLAFTLIPLPPGPFEIRHVLRDPWVLVVQAGSAAAEQARSVRDLRALGRLPLVCFRAPRAIDPVLGFFREAEVEPNLVLQSDYNDAVQEAAAAGRGVALMPRLCVNPSDERISIVDLGDLFPPREIAVAWRGDRPVSEALYAFVELAIEIGARVEDRNDTSSARRLQLASKSHSATSGDGDPLRVSAVP
jgi:DNA-binding transcriptional LysR family regulator